MMDINKIYKYDNYFYKISLTKTSSFFKDKKLSKNTKIKQIDKLNKLANLEFKEVSTYTSKCEYTNTLINKHLGLFIDGDFKVYLNVKVLA